ncbi:hypothetical protein ACLKA7_013469 [Drosophila subpalustris]
MHLRDKIRRATRGRGSVTITIIININFNITTRHICFWLSGVSNLRWHAAFMLKSKIRLMMMMVVVEVVVMVVGLRFDAVRAAAIIVLNFVRV